MIDDRELWACANLLLRQHGAEAAGIAEARAETLGAGGAPDGQRAFRRIASHIRTLGVFAPVGRPH